MTKIKLRFALATILFASLLALSSTNIAQAQWPAISSGYAVTTDWHGEDVVIGQSVTATAGTTDSGVTQVEFRWLDPGGNVEFGGGIFVDVFGPYTTPNVPPNVPQEIIDWANDNQGVDILYAQNTQIPDEIGDWAVQANFHDTGNPGGQSLRGRNQDIVAIRATSFNVVPEVPFGTIVILLSMFGALGVFAIKRKHLHEKMPS